jgi:hypothetical protein
MPWTPTVHVNPAPTFAVGDMLAFKWGSGVVREVRHAGSRGLDATQYVLEDDKGQRRIAMHFEVDFRHSSRPSLKVIAGTAVAA